ncbi:MAG: histidine kinase dimerization/phospho-acceptor domain-containing protein [Candidatus Omnitrophota bacterium]|jgi:signal transduction histidine kinase
MEIEKLKEKTKRDFNNTVCLMGIIPFLSLVYLLVGKNASFAAIPREARYIMAITVILILAGIVTGRKLIWALIEEVLEKNKLAAISETVLSLGHEINNPLLIMQGNLELLEHDFAKNNIADNLKERLAQVKNRCERIMEVTQKMSSLTRPASVSISGDSKMIDLAGSG